MLVAHFPLIEDADDKTGHGYSIHSPEGLPSVPEPLTDAPNRFGKSMTCANSFINLKYNAGSRWSESTLSCWVYVSQHLLDDLDQSFATTYEEKCCCIFGSMDYDGFAIYIRLRRGGSHWEVFSYYREEDEIGFETGTTPLSKGGWYHFATSYKRYEENGVSKQDTFFYINGELKEKTVNTVFSNNPKRYTPRITRETYGMNTQRHAYGDGLKTTACGYFNELRIYDECLTYDEILKLAKPLLMHYNFSAQTPYCGEYTEHVNATYIYNNRAGTIDCSYYDANELSYAKYRGNTVRRFSMKVLSGKSNSDEALDNVRINLCDHGLRTDNYSFKNNEWVEFCLVWRPITHPDIYISGMAKNKGDGEDQGTFEYDDGWRISYAVRKCFEDCSDYIFWSLKCPSAVFDQEVIIEYCSLQVVRHINKPFEPVWAATPQSKIIYDASGNCLNGTAMSRNTEQPVYPMWKKGGPGGLGYYYFNGGSSRLGNGTAIEVPTLYLEEEMTVSGWMRKDAPESWDTILRSGHEELECSLISSTEGGGFAIGKCLNEEFLMCICLEGGYVIVVVPPEYAAELDSREWNFFAFTYNHEWIRAYINGREIGKKPTGQRPFNIVNQGKKTYIGTESEGFNPSTRGWHGGIADVRIYAAVLNDDEIRELYEIGTKVSGGDTKVVGGNSQKAVLMSHGFSELNAYGEDSVDLTAPSVDAERIIKNYNQPANNILPAQFSDSKLWWMGDTNSLDNMHSTKSYKMQGDGCVYTEGTFKHSRAFPIDQYGVYQGEIYFSRLPGSPEIDGSIWMGITDIDTHGNMIEIPMTDIHHESDTTLSLPLKPGDTVAYVESGTPLYIHPSGYSHFAVFDRPESNEYVCARRIWRMSNSSAGIVNLSSPWPYETIPVGTKVGVGFDGGTYVYPISHYDVGTITRYNKGSWYRIPFGFCGPLSSNPNGFVRLRPFSTHASVIFYVERDPGLKLAFTGLSIRNVTRAQQHRFSFVNVHTGDFTPIQPVLGLPSAQITKTGVTKSKMIREIGRKIRHIRIVSEPRREGFSQTTQDIVQIEAYNSEGTNVALGTVLRSLGPNDEGTHNEPACVTNGNLSSLNYYTAPLDYTLSLHMDEVVDYIKLYRFWGDNSVPKSFNQRYKRTQVMVSLDKKNWTTIYDTVSEPWWVESEKGKVFYLRNDKLEISADGDICVGKIKEV